MNELSIITILYDCGISLTAFVVGSIFIFKFATNKLISSIGLVLYLIGFINLIISLLLFIFNI